MISSTVQLKPQPNKIDLNPKSARKTVETSKESRTFEGYDIVVHKFNVQIENRHHHQQPTTTTQPTHINFDGDDGTLHYLSSYPNYYTTEKIHGETVIKDI